MSLGSCFLLVSLTKYLFLQGLFIIHYSAGLLREEGRYLAPPCYNPRKFSFPWIRQKVWPASAAPENMGWTWSCVICVVWLTLVPTVIELQLLFLDPTLVDILNEARMEVRVGLLSAERQRYSCGRMAVLALLLLLMQGAMGLSSMFDRTIQPFPKFSFSLLGLLAVVVLLFSGVLYLFHTIEVRILQGTEEQMRVGLQTLQDKLSSDWCSCWSLHRDQETLTEGKRPQGPVLMPGGGGLAAII